MIQLEAHWPSELELREVSAGGFSLHSCSCCMHQLHSISLAHLTHSTLLCFIHSISFHSLTSLILLCFSHSVHSISLTNFTQSNLRHSFITQHFTYSLHSFYSASVIYYIAFHSLTSLILLYFIRSLNGLSLTHVTHSVLPHPCPTCHFPNSHHSFYFASFIHCRLVQSLTSLILLCFTHSLHSSSLTHFTHFTLIYLFITQHFPPSLHSSYVLHSFFTPHFTHSLHSFYFASFIHYIAFHSLTSLILLASFIYYVAFHSLESLPLPILSLHGISLISGNFPHHRCFIHSLYGNSLT